ncbi:hypothetical protein GCM10017774_42880 [Lentzea cavernae]|uniref:Uncharacterized protein n=1 Tax=Lentzea cavernae TaxID=2020703 RepID=A0ABQ3MMJ8_9PSEU|nr:hypothetical protein GCM10017774_42880 [Lentzea cavernae]
MIVEETSSAEGSGCVRFDVTVKNNEQGWSSIRGIHLSILNTWHLKATCGGKGATGRPIEVSRNYNVAIDLEKVPNDFLFDQINQGVEPGQFDRFTVTANIRNLRGGVGILSVVEAKIGIYHGDEIAPVEAGPFLFLTNPNHEPSETFGEPSSPPPYDLGNSNVLADAKRNREIGLSLAAMKDTPKTLRSEELVRFLSATPRKKCN